MSFVKPTILFRSFHVSARRSALYKHPDIATFQKHITHKDRITIVDFYADWCGPCKTLTPVLEKLTSEPAKTKLGLPFDLIEIDIDSSDGQTLAAQHRVTAVPTVYAFLDNSPIGSFKGAIPEPSVKKFLDDLN